MKRSLLLSANLFVALCISSTLHAQIVTDTTRFSESVWSMKKKKMVVDQFTLTEAEKASFWPLYESFYQSIRYIEMENLEMLDVYYRLGHTLHPGELEKISKRILLNDCLIAKVRKQYYKRFSKALSPNIATHFMHFDETIRTYQRMEVATLAQHGGYTKASLH